MRENALVYFFNYICLRKSYNLLNVVTDLKLTFFRAYQRGLIFSCMS